MNRKGMEAWVVIGAVIAVGVLVAVIGGIYFFKEDIAKWIGFLPIPGKIDTSKNVLEIVGYDLEKNEIQYYNGKDWVKFDTIITLNNKEVSPNIVGEAVNLGYFSGSLRKAPVSYDIGRKKMTILFFMKSYPLSGKDVVWIWGTSKWSKGINSIVKISYGWESYILDSRDVLYKYKSPEPFVNDNGEFREVSPSPAESEMVKKAIWWRDAPLENPQTLVYDVLADDGTKKIESKDVCIKKYGIKLSIDLSKDVSGGYCI